MNKSDLTKDMISSLRKIAKRGIAIMHGKRTKMGRTIWLGFDDAYIQWFLHDHPKATGRAIENLRAEYSKACSEPGRLYFWPFTKTQAGALLKGIGRPNGS